MTKDLKQRAMEFSAQPKMRIELKVSLRTREELSLAYTPGIAEVSRAIVDDPGVLKTHTFVRNNLAVISEGSAVLGLGNIGHKGAYPVMEGKAMLFKRFAGIDAVPIVVRTQDVDEFVSVVENIADSFGAINLEDIAAPACFEIEKRLRKSLKIPLMHDDQHGTAVVVLAAVLGAMKLTGREGKKNLKIVLSGAGAAGMGITSILLTYGFSEIIVVDSQGAIYEGREGLNETKRMMAKGTNKAKVKGSLVEVIKGADVFVGVSRAGVLSGEMVKSMNKDAIVIAMANPVPEIMPDEALAAGAAVVGTGRSDFDNQVNNALAFPSIFRAAMDMGCQINADAFVAAAEAIVKYHEKDLAMDNLMPSILDEKAHAAITETLKKKWKC